MSRFSGARIGEDQKLKFLNELLDAALEQFVSFPAQCARQRLSATKQCTYSLPLLSTPLVPL
jgi:hypothetical protein